MILDDVLTGLDRETEKVVLDAVLGTRGIVRELGQTVILATNSGLSFFENFIQPGVLTDYFRTSCCLL